MFTETGDLGISGQPPDLHGFQSGGGSPPEKMGKTAGDEGEAAEARPEQGRPDPGPGKAGEAAPTTAVGGVTPAGWSGVSAGHRGRRLPRPDPRRREVEEAGDGGAARAASVRWRWVATELGRAMGVTGSGSAATMDRTRCGAAMWQSGGGECWPG